MQGRLYRGTSLGMARLQEFADGHVHGKEFDVVEGFMDPEDIGREWTASYVEDLPWEAGPKYEKAHVVGGISDRLGAAYNFADGAVPVVFHLDGSRLSNLQSVGYSYRWFDSFEGGMPWYDGTRTGELRINGDLKGLLAKDPEDGTQAIAYYGDALRSRARDYEDEMEMLAHGEALDISDAVDLVASYVRRPVTALSHLDGYARVESKLQAERGDTVVGDWSDSRAMEELYDTLRDAAPPEWPVYVVHVEKDLVMASWGYEDHNVLGGYGADGELSTADLPGRVYGDM